MNNRKAFTLIEITIATLIFSFIAVSMSTIYSAASKHVFQNYRANAVKVNTNLSMRALRNVMAQATRIDQPALNSVGSRLAVAVNVDQASGCYPITSDAGTATWHLFCTVNSGGNIRLYYHTGEYSGACACPGTCVASNPAITAPCGGAGGMLLAQYLTTMNVFSRSWTLGDIPSGSTTLVKATIHSIWNPASTIAGQRRVDFRLENLFAVSAAAS